MACGKRRGDCLDEKSDSEAAARAHQADAIKFGLFSGIVHGAFAHLVALVEQLDFLELLEGFGKRRTGVVELAFKIIGRTLEIVAPGDRRLGVGRIGEMRRIVNPGSLLLGQDLAIKIDGHAIEVGNHGLDLRHLPPLFIHLKFPQANQRLSRLHRPIPPEVSVFGLSTALASSGAGRH
jgi:hypothetical protein